MVEANYRNNINEIDSKASFNPLFDCEPEIIVDESICVKTEIDRLDPCAPTEYGTIYIPSTSDWDNSNRQKDEENSKFLEEVDHLNKSLAAEQRSLSRKKRKLAIQTEQSKRKKTGNIEASSSELKKPASSWQLPSDVEKIM